MVYLSVRYSLFKKLLKSKTHIDLHQTEPVPRRSVGGGVRLNAASLFARTWLENGEETHRSTAKVDTLHIAIHGATMAKSPSRPSGSASPTCRRASATTLVTPYVRQARSSTWAVPPSGPAGNSRRPVARRRGARRRPRQSCEASQ